MYLGLLATSRYEVTPPDFFIFKLVVSAPKTTRQSDITSGDLSEFMQLPLKPHKTFIQPQLVTGVSIMIGCERGQLCFSSVIYKQGRGEDHCIKKNSTWAREHFIKLLSDSCL